MPQQRSALRSARRVLRSAQCGGEKRRAVRSSSGGPPVIHRFGPGLPMSHA